MWVISAAIQILIIGVVFGVLLQLASRIVLKESVEFGDAFKAAIVASAAIFLADFGLINAMDPGFTYSMVYLVSTFVIWILALMIVIGLDLIQSFLIALVFMIITFVLQFLLDFFLALIVSTSSILPP